MAGQLEHRFHSYLAVCYLLKEPLAGIIAFWYWCIRTPAHKKSLHARQMFLLIPPAVLFAGLYGLVRQFGIRYLIPVLPFVYLVGGLGLETLLRNGSCHWRVPQPS